MLSVFLADDHEVLRAGLRALIDARPDMGVVGEAGTGSETYAGLARQPVDVLVLDLSLPDTSGVDMVRRLRAVYPDLAIVVLTMYPEDQLALALLRSGASAYLNKTRSSTEVLRAIERVGAGQPYLTDTLSEMAQDPDADRATLPHTRLSAREFQIFVLLIAGKTVSEAGHDMGVSASTASSFVAKVKQKLGVDSVGEIVRYAHRVGLLG